MQRAKVLAVAIILSTATYTAAAQHGGHGGGYGGGAGHSGHGNSGMGDMQRQMALQATPEQRDMFQQCDKNANGFRAGAEQIGQSFASRKGSEQVRSQLEEVRNQFEAMQRTHKALVGSLNHEQHKATKGQVGKLQKLEGSLEANLKALDTELAGPTPNSGRVNKTLKKLQNDTQEWRKQHSKIASELGMSG